MKCFSEEIYAAYLDDELSQRESTLVSDHLNTCRACRELSEQLENENRMIKTGFSIDLPEVNMVDEIMQHIKPNEVLIHPNGRRLSYILYTVLMLSGIGFPIITFQLFSSCMDTFHVILALLASPLVILFDRLLFFVSSILNTLMIDIPQLVVLVVSSTLLVFFWMSFLFTKGCEASRQG
ncbi:anti-sigma factor family protein [Thermodesulfobacteriota bacterium]